MTLSILKKFEVSSQLENAKAAVVAVPDSELLDALTTALDDEACRNFELGGFLFRIQDGKHWPKTTEDGKMQSFRGWVLAEHGIRKSRAYHLIEVYEALSECSLPADAIERVKGWTKIVIIAPVLTTGTTKKAAAQNEDWLKKAETHSRAELVKLVAAVRKKKDAQTDGDTPTQHILRFDKIEQSVWEKAVCRAREVEGVESEKDAAVYIADCFTKSQSKG